MASTRSNIVNSDESTGINNFDSGNIHVWPNPASNLLYLNLDLKINPFTYSIINMEGKILLSGLITEELTAVDISHLDQGVYFLLIENEQMVMHKLLIQ